MLLGLPEVQAEEITDPVPAPLPVLRNGSSYDGVRRLQEYLTALGYGETGTDGVFGKSTESAVVAYQADKGYEQTGEVTMDLLDEILAQVTPEPTPTPEPTLKAGMWDDDVRDLQAKLLALGYSARKADGIFGESTLDAVKAWQADQGYEQTGVVTLSQMNEIMAQATPEPTPTPTPTPVPTPSPTPLPDISGIDGTLAFVRVNEDSYLNLRAQYFVESPVLTTLTNGTIVKVLDKRLVWSIVETLDGLRGWVGTKYIEIIDRETYNSGAGN